MQSRLLGARIAVLAGLIALAGCGAATSAPPHPPATNGPRTMTAPHSSDGHLKVSLVLSFTVVKAGTPLHGVLIVLNPTGHDVHVPCFGGIAVGLDSPSLPFRPIWDLTCHPVTTVRPGATRTNESIPTEYAECTQAATGSPQSPPCLPSAVCHPAGSRCIAPVLPAGNYRVKLQVLGNAAASYDLPAPATITVQ